MLKPAFVDLSHHNTVQSLQLAKDAGIVGVIHKLTESTGFVDSKVDNRYFLATDAGLLWGLYHFIRPGNIQRQAEFFCSKAQELGVCDKDTLYCLDYEDAGVSLDDCVTFMKVVEQITGHDPVIYSGHVLKEKLKGKPDSRLVGYRLWLAQYGSDYDLPPGWSSFWGWQYSDKGSVPGIGPPTDVNAYETTADDLRDDWSGKPGDVEPPQPVPTGTMEILIKLDLDPPDAKVKIISVTVV